MHQLPNIHSMSINLRFPRQLALGFSSINDSINSKHYLSRYRLVDFRIHSHGGTLVAAAKILLSNGSLN